MSEETLRKLTLWHTIDWYTSSIGTEHETRERAVLDRAIDAALADSADAPEGPTVEQIARILCPGYAHNLRGLMTDEDRDAGKACARCHVWAIEIRDALNRLDAQQGEDDGRLRVPQPQSTTET